MSPIVEAILITAGFEQNDEGDWIFETDNGEVFKAEICEQGIEPELLVYEVSGGIDSDPITFGNFILGL